MYPKLTEMEKAVYHLITVWQVYGRNQTHPDSDHLVHSDMSTGEAAGEWLEAHGYVECGGYADQLTDKAKELLKRVEGGS